MERPAAFEVDDYDEATRTDWSVLVRGRIDIIDEPVEVERLERLGHVRDAHAVIVEE